MALLPVPPMVPPGFLGGPDKVDDALVKDERVRVSEVLRRNGFPAGVARSQGAPLAIAESGADPSRENTSAGCSPSGDRAIGLMQICTVHKGKMGIPADMGAAVKWLKNADNNAAVAYKIWLGAGGTFAGDWEAFTNGAWQKFKGQDPIITVSKNSASDTVTDAAAGAIDAALGPIDELASALLSPDTWFRLFKGAAGGSLLLIGIGALTLIVAARAAKTKPVKSAVKVASSAVPAVKGAKLAAAANAAT